MGQLNITIPTTQAATGAATIKRLLEDLKAVTVDMARVMQQGFAQIGTSLRSLAGTATPAQQAVGALNNTFVNITATSKAMVQATREQTAAYTQVAAAALAYKQQQDQLRESLRRQREAQRQANEEASKSWTIWQQALGVAGGIGIATSIGQVVSGLRSMASESVNAAVKMQSLIATFTAIEGSATKGAQTLGFLREQANRVGVDFTRSATAFKGIDAAARGTSLEGQKTRDIFVAISEASRVLGLSSEQTGRILTAIQQIMSKGKVSAEELRQQIGEHLPGAFSIAARAMGVTTAQLDKMLSTGRLMAEDFLPRFAAQIKQELGPGIEAAAQTAAATFARLGNEVKELSVRVGESILVLLQPLAKFATDLLEKARRANEEAGQSQARPLGQALLTAPGAGVRTPMTIAEGATVAEQRQLNEKARLIEEAQDRIAALPPPWLGLTFGVETHEKRIARLQAEVVAINEVIKARTQQRALEASAVDDFGNVGGTRRVVEAERKGIQDRLKAIVDEREKAFTQIDLDAARFPASFTAADVLKDKTKAAEDAVEALRAELAKLPAAVQAGFQFPAAALPYQEMITRLSAMHNVDPSLVTALIAQESGFNPRAVSSAGAQGLMQLMPGTARSMGVTDPFDPAQNIAGGVRYLADMLRQFSGDVGKALTAYNAGPAGGGIPQRRGENATFAEEVLARQGTMGGAAGGILAEADATLARLRAQAEGDQPDTERLAQARATGQEYLRGIDQEIQQRTQASESLQRLADGYTKTKEARDVDTASMIRAQFAGKADVESERIVQLANLVIQHAQEREAIEAKIPALQAAAQASADYYQGVTKAGQALGRYQEQRNLSGGARITAEARAATRAAVELGPLKGTDKEGEAREVLEHFRRLAKEAEPGFQELTRITNDFAEVFLSTIDRATQGGIKSFKDFADSVLLDLQRIVAQRVVIRATGLLIDAGIKALGGLAGAAAGGVATTGLENSGISAANIPTAAGGPVYSGGSYVVGESGPEPFFPAVDGRILSHADAMAALSVGRGDTGNLPPIIVNINGVQEMSTFVRSQGEVEKALLRAVQKAQRSA